jgi:hypothetical protein
MRKAILALALFFLAMPLMVHGHGRGRATVQSSHSSRSSSTASHRSSSPKVYRSKSTRPSSVRCVGCKRDSHGRIKRSATARNEFKRSHPCPATGKTTSACPGYVIDHIQALKHGGADQSSNMQWQTKAQAKAKDRIE